VFEALADGDKSAGEIAAATGTHPQATEKLLNALLGARYLRFSDGRYQLAPVARRWLLGASPQSVRDKVLFQFWEWATIERAEERMLDVGGAHGYFSVAFCKKHPRLSSVVLDLPQAVRHSAPILARENMGERVVHEVGDALTSDLGTGRYDFILLSALVHHFDDATNRRLMARCAAALKPGGVCAVFEALRVDAGSGVGQVGGRLGLAPRRPMRLRLARDLAMVAADKPS
jgi:SAM-dependent methyltransferase